MQSHWHTPFLRLVIVFWFGMSGFFAYLTWAGAPLLWPLVISGTVAVLTVAGFTIHVLDREPRNILKPAGSRLRSFAVFVYSKKDYRRVFEPIISDMRLEYNEALANGETWHARWIHVRGTLAFCTAMLARAGVSVMKLMQRVWTAAS